MRTKDLLELILLAAVWGASFLFLRLASPEFGPVAVAAVRVAVAVLVLLPLLLWRGMAAEMRGRALPLLVVGAFNSAVPFCLFAYALLSMTGGFASILNATAPLWSGLVAFLWLGERLSMSRVAGLLIGFGGVVVLVWGKGAPQVAGTPAAMAVILFSTLLYAIAANFTKRYLSGVSSLALTAGSQVAATVLLLPIAVWQWPRHNVSVGAWSAAIALGVICTGLAYLMYFRLIARIGPARAIAVTFLIPVFGMLWGSLFLAEPITVSMIVGGVVILFGTAMATGTLAFARAQRAG